MWCIMYDSWRLDMFEVILYLFLTLPHQGGKGNSVQKKYIDIYLQHPYEKFSFIMTSCMNFLVFT